MPVEQKPDVVLAVPEVDRGPTRDAFDATPAECAFEAVSDVVQLRDHLDEADPDLVLISLDLPGLEIPAGLRSLTERYSRIPFVVLASNDEESEARAALAAGARDRVFRSELNSVTMARILRHLGDRRRADWALETATRRYEAVLDATTDGLLVVDAEGRIRDANENAETMFGYERGELEGMSVDELVPDASREEHAGLRDHFMAEPVPRPMAAGTELRGKRSDGTEFPAEIGLSPYNAGDSMYVFAAVRDMTSAERLRRMSAAVEATDDLIITIDLEGTIETWNAAAAHRFGRKEEEVIGRSLRSFLAPEALEELPDVLRRLRSGEHVSSVDNADRDSEGKGFHLSLSFSPVLGRDGDPHAAVVMGRDVTHRKLLEKDLERLAYYDALTGLANRRLLHERLDYAIALARRQGHHVGVLYLDLGRFKDINDRLGHGGGDAVLVEVARRLSEVARDSDLVAREGGDEFVILLSELSGLEDALDAGRRIRGAFEKPLTVEGETISLDMQLGVALFPNHGSDAVELIAAADQAMYRRKAAARAGEPAATFPAIARGDDFEQELREALDEGQLCLHFQPIMRSSDDTLAGLEALLRWTHPRRGLLLAADFLAQAREHGLMPILDRWAVGEAVRTMRELASADLQDFWVSVNLSSQTLRRPESADWMKESVGENGILGRLRVEVRSSEAFASPVVLQTLEQIHGYGVGISLDNYGSGDSPVARLRDTPAWCVKMDRELISHIDENGDGLRLARATIELGHAAGLQVVVEGIERESQRARLRGTECDFLQGYYMGRPAPADAIWN